MVPWAHPNPHPKRHLNQFSRFLRALDHKRLAVHAGPSCDNMPHLCSIAMWPNNHANICKGTVNQKSQLNQLCWKKSLLDYDAKYNVQCTSEMSVTSACTARLRFLIKNALYKSTVITVIIIITVVHSPYASVNEAAP